MKIILNILDTPASLSYFAEALPTTYESAEEMVNILAQTAIRTLAKEKGEVNDNNK